MKKLFYLALTPLFVACSGSPTKVNQDSGGIIRHLAPYRIDVRQGNHITQDMVNRLRQGLTMDQVRFVLGTPLLIDVFHADRWDYIYRMETGLGRVEQKRLSVFFKEGRLDKLEGDFQLGKATASGAPDNLAEQPANRVIDITAPIKK